MYHQTMVSFCCENITYVHIKSAGSQYQIWKQLNGLWNDRYREDDCQGDFEVVITLKM